MSFPAGVIVDQDVEKELGHLRWGAYPTSKNGKPRVARYWKVKGKQYGEYLSRRIMDVAPEVEVDHINLNTLDNRRENLRAVSRGENAQNQPIRRDNTSGYRGVVWEKTKRKWRGGAHLGGRFHFVGYFDRVEAAALAVTEWRREHMPFSEMDKVPV
jgi:hypothetical protein